MGLSTRDALLAECFGRAGLTVGDVTLEVREAGLLVSQLDIYWRTVRAGRRRTNVMAVGNVCTAPAARGRGYASALVTAAHTVGRRRGVSHAALWSDYLGFYRPHGYQPTPVESFLVAALAGDPWPAGPIDPGGNW